MASQIGKKGYAVTPSDNQKLSNPGTLYIGSGGTLRVTLLEQQNNEYLDFNPSDDRDFPYEVKKVWATGTTASNILVITGGE